MLCVEEAGPAGARLVTTEPYAAGQVIARITRYVERRRPTQHSIQAGPDRHVEGLGPLSYLNHSCAPNTIVDTERLVVVAARDIAAGEELTFFYPSTEWDMAEPFACLCGAAACLGTVAGAKHLAAEQLQRYHVNAHIRELARTRRP